MVFTIVYLYVPPHTLPEYKQGPDSQHLWKLNFTVISLYSHLMHEKEKLTTAHIGSKNVLISGSTFLEFTSSLHAILLLLSLIFLKIDQKNKEINGEVKLICNSWFSFFYKNDELILNHKTCSIHVNKRVIDVISHHLLLIKVVLALGRSWKGLFNLKYINSVLVASKVNRQLPSYFRVSRNPVSLVSISWLSFRDFSESRKLL